VEVVRQHVEHRESYRVMAKRIRERSGRTISPTTLNRIVQNIGKRSKSVFEMSLELKPRWEGYLVADEKMVSVRGEHQWFYLAVDSSGDIVHVRAVPELTSTEAMKFLEEITTSLRYPVRGVSTDFDSSLGFAVQKLFAGKPHQLCLKHAFSSLEKLIGYKAFAQRQRWNQTTMRGEFEKLRDKKGIWVEKARKGFFENYREYTTLSKRHKHLEILRKHLHQIVFARAETLAAERLQAFKRMYVHALVKRQRKEAVKFLERHWDKLMIYHNYLGLPRTTNLVENVNKQLQRRMKTIEAFQSQTGAEQYINLLVGYLRQKPYTDCRGKRKHLNGFSRLEAAGVKLEQKDWIKNCLKNP